MTPKCQAFRDMPAPSGYDAAADAPPAPPAPDARPTATMAELREATKLGSTRCWFSERDSGCGCSGLLCHLLGRRINIYDCVECLGKL